MVKSGLEFFYFEIHRGGEKIEKYVNGFFNFFCFDDPWL